MDLTRRRAMGLATWSAGVALVGSVATRRQSRLAPGTVDAGHVVAPPAGRSSASSAGRSPGSTPAAVRATGTAAVPAAIEEQSTALLTGDDLVLHVARRTSFGPTPTLLEAIRSSGVDGWLERQLRPSAIADDEVDERLVRLRDLDRGPSELRDTGRSGDDALADLRVAAAVRAVHSNRHLQEVMVDLWHDHLVASAAKAPVEWHLPTYDREVIRPFALGRYVDLLRAATRSGAMLEYLDTTSSSAPDVNENHGRELLELHTIGRAAGFGQGDVAGAARVLSGWTLDPDRLAVTFDPTRHHSGPASVLGWSTPGRSGTAGAADLDSLLGYLATHPATATRIASLLVRRFVADAPPPDVVESTAAAYLAAGTDLGATLRHLFATPAFRSSSAPIVRRPFDLFAAQLRAVAATLEVPNVAERLLRDDGDLDGAGMADPLAEPLTRGVIEPRPVAGSVTEALRRNGQLLFAAPNPSGHPLAGGRWSSGDALLRRWTLGAFLAQDGLAGISIDPDALAGGAPTAGTAVEALAQRCFSAPPSPTTRAGTLAAMDSTAGDPVDTPQRLRLALSFLLAAPEMQVR